MSELTHSHNGPPAVRAVVESQVWFSYCEGGVVDVVDVCFVSCADIVVLALGAVGDVILGGWIHDGCDELKNGIIRSRSVIICDYFPKNWGPVSSLYIWILGSIRGSARFEQVLYEPTLTRLGSFPRSVCLVSPHAIRCVGIGPQLLIAV